MTHEKMRALSHRDEAAPAVISARRKLPPEVLAAIRADVDSMGISQWPVPSSATMDVVRRALAPLPAAPGASEGQQGAVA